MWLNKQFLHHSQQRADLRGWFPGCLTAGVVASPCHHSEGEGVSHHCPQGKWLIPRLPQWHILDKKYTTYHCIEDGSRDLSTGHNKNIYIYNAVNNSEDSSHIHYTEKNNKKKARETCYAEPSLQQQATSDDYIESGGVIFKEARFSLS